MGKGRVMKDWFWINRSAIREHGKMLGATPIAVLAVLACCENDESRDCFPSISYISNTLNTGRATVMRAIKLLESFGYLEKTKINGRKNIYKLTTPTGVVLTGNHTSTTTELVPVPPQNSKEHNIKNIIKEPAVVPTGPKPYMLGINYFYSAYLQKYNMKYPVDRVRYIKQLQNSELPFESFKLMIDRFLDGGGKDFQKFIWQIPELFASVAPAQKLARDPRLDMTPEERLRADGWYD